jgi:sterol O-acyltransferase
MFARDWNKPVHEWLFRHIYHATLTSYPNAGKQSATYLTFFFSSIFHEIALSVVSRKLRLWMFAMQMTQLPLIYIGRLPAIRKYPTLGNIFFWIGMIIGLPLITLGYSREYFMEKL